MPEIVAKLQNTNLKGTFRKQAEKRFAREAIRIGGNNVMQIYKTTKDDPYGAWATIHSQAISGTVSHLGHGETLAGARFILTIA